jgi:hypothetical protein
VAKRKKKKLVIPEVIHETVYALRHIETGHLLRMESTSNDGSDFCNDRTVRLSHWSGDDEPFDMDTWYIDSMWNAEYVRQFSTEWYNSGERCPKHDYKPDELEIVEVKREIRTAVKHVRIPTFLEYMALSYKEKEKGHYEYIKGEYEKDVASKFGPRQQWSYSLYDLLMAIENGKWNPEGDNDETKND